MLNKVDIENKQIFSWLMHHITLIKIDMVSSKTLYCKLTPSRYLNNAPYTFF